MIRSTLSLTAFLTAAALTSTASAGGFYLVDRGVRPLGRGGAFVAGADDGHAIWYNPAGLTEAGNGLLLDASLVLFSNTYTRSARPDGAMAPVTFAPSEGSGAPLPIPTLVFTHDFGVRNFRFAAGAFAPYAALPTYSAAADAPQRYTLTTLDGSLLAMVGVWAAYRPHPMVSFGAGFQMLVGSFVSQLAFSACPATVTCAPEDPQWDSAAQLSVGPIAAPTGNVGVRVNPHRMVSIGASFQLPISVDSGATLKVRLPSAPFYDGARVEGDQAQVSFSLAPIARLGVEVRPTEATRVEVAAVWEGWSVHDAINLVPQGIRITNARAVGTYEVGNVSLTRNFQDVWSFRLGAEHRFDVGSYGVTARAGFSYDTGATPLQYTNVLTFDADKATVSLGASLTRGRLRLDAVYAHTFWGPVEVTPCAYDPRSPASCQGLYPTAPFRAGANAPRYTVNGGTYEPSLNVFGLGMRYAF
ncbi:MAG: outer membrane protein transport protein [Polyangiales bacterium]